jgi:hypothetical protein
MQSPVRTSASWLAGRVLVFAVILLVLVVWDAYREESLLLAALTKGLLPDKELVRRLEEGRRRLESAAESAERETEARLELLQKRGEVEIDARITELDARIEALESSRSPAWRKAMAAVSGEGLEKEIELELELQLGRAERDALKQLKGELEAIHAALIEAEGAKKLAYRHWQGACAGYVAAKAGRESFIEAHPISSRMPLLGDRDQLDGIDGLVRKWALDCSHAYEKFKTARTVVSSTKLQTAQVRHIDSSKDLVLSPLVELIESKKAVVESTENEMRRILRSTQRMLLQAFGILVAVTSAPLGIKALWFWLLAPIVENRPPIRILMRGPEPRASDSAVSRQKISAVSQDIVLEDEDELLLHPDFLQSSTRLSHKRTKWLLDSSYPFTSIAAGMVMLTRIRSMTREPVVVSSRNDAFSEIGVIELQADEPLVLQPRSLVGVVQRVDRPIRIQRRWVLGLSAWITLQFRYLVFVGPGKLLVRGCRGVRVETAGTGRSIDQNATMGFSANLDYRPRRSETFSAYAMGVNGLFNDSFSGGPGYCVYEEKPYFGQRSGITGRGLTGLTDAMLKIVGI